MRYTGTDGKQFYVYALPPIDWWPGWTDLEELERKFWGLHEWGGTGPDFPRATIEEAARQVGWEGDGRWKVAPLPADGDCELMYAVKQQNNGTTFIVSPFALPWLS